jgi:calcium-dependent protein kinase
VGTPHYVAPEMLEGSYGFECDIWSLGVILYVMLSGQFPFHASTPAEVFEKIKKNDVKFLFKEWDEVSNEAKDLIKKLLTKNPKKRYTALQAMDHSWFDIIRKD